MFLWVPQLERKICTPIEKEIYFHFRRGCAEGYIYPWQYSQGKIVFYSIQYMNLLKNRPGCFSASSYAQILKSTDV